METVLTTHIAEERYRRIDGYRASGGYEALRKSLSMAREAIVEEVKKADLRGRGGAGFPAGVKWGFLPKDLSRPRVLVVNADEGEPGTFKDRLSPRPRPALPDRGDRDRCLCPPDPPRLRLHPRRVRARGADPRGGRRGGARRPRMIGKNFLGSGFDLDVVVHRGAGAYICGEETSTINSLEGKRGWPRLKPPFPAVVGAFGLPTLVNNVETLCSVPWIVMNGGARFAAPRGREERRDAAGRCQRPRDAARPLRAARERQPARASSSTSPAACSDGKTLKAVIPGGSSTPVLRADEIDVTIDIESMVKAGTMTGTCGRHRHPGGYLHGPRPVGSGELLRARVVRAVHAVPGGHRVDRPDRSGRSRRGRGGRATWRRSSTSATTSPARPSARCADGAVMPVQSFIGKFRGEFDGTSPTGSARSATGSRRRDGMPNLTIDGIPVTAPEGESILNAAKRVGIEIPHYCYHTHLSIAGNCRMCQVEVDKMSKLQIACATPVTEGMVVHTRHGEGAQGASGATLEFLLIHHPIDCPICDQSGECRLQDYYMIHGLHKSRYPLEEKVHKKKVQDIGGGIVLDAERCVLCSRCVRFLAEVTGTRELDFFQRADHSEISIFPGRPLDNNYCYNLADICPVGALTEQGFPVQVPRLVPEVDGFDLHRLRPGVQHRGPLQGRHHVPAEAAPQRVGQPDLDVRLRPAGVPERERGAAARALRPRGREGAGRSLGRAAGACGGPAVGGGVEGRPRHRGGDRLPAVLQRGALPRPPDRVRPAGDPEPGLHPPEAGGRLLGRLPHPRRQEPQQPRRPLLRGSPKERRSTPWSPGWRPGRSAPSWFSGTSSARTRRRTPGRSCRRSPSSRRSGRTRGRCRASRTPSCRPPPSRSGRAPSPTATAGCRLFREGFPPRGRARNTVRILVGAGGTARFRVVLQGRAGRLRGAVADRGRPSAGMTYESLGGQGQAAGT